MKTDFFTEKLNLVGLPDDFNLYLMNGGICLNQQSCATMRKGATSFFQKDSQHYGYLRSFTPTLYSGVWFDNGKYNTFKGAVQLFYKVDFEDVKTHKKKTFTITLGHTKLDNFLVYKQEFSMKPGDAAFGDLATLLLDQHQHIRFTCDEATATQIGFGFFDLQLNEVGNRMEGFAWESENIYGEKEIENEALYIVKGNYISSTDNLEIPILKDTDFPICQQLALRNHETHYVEELASLPLPENIDAINDKYSRVMENLMVYAINDTQRSYIGRRKPVIGIDINQQQADFLNDEDIKDFLVNDYYFAYFSTMLSSGQFRESKWITEIDDQENRLKYYWKGEDTSGFISQKGYKKLSNPLYDTCYFMGDSILEDFRQDAVRWADELYAYILADGNFHQHWNALSDEKQPLLYHLVKLLDTLDPSNVIEQKEGINDTLLVSRSSSILRQTLNHVLAKEGCKKGERKLYNTPEKQQKMIIDTAKSYITDLMKRRESASDDEKLIIAEIDKALESKQITEAPDYTYIVIDAAELFDLATDVLLQSLGSCMKKITRRGLQVGCESIACIVMEVFYLWDIIATFNDYASLNDLEKADLYLETMLSITIAGSTISSVISKFRKEKIEAATDLGDNTSHLDLMRGSSAKAIQKDLVSFRDKLISKTTKITKWARFLGTALCALSFALSVCYILEDKEEYGDVVYGLDIACCIVEGLSFLMAGGFFIAGFFAIGSSVVVASLPVVGWVLAIVGIVLALLTDILKECLPTAEEDYIRDNCVPFVKVLPVPDKEWLETMKVQEEGLAA